MKKNTYLLLAAAGVILPYYYFVPWTSGNGFDLPQMIKLMFANPIASGIAADAIMVALSVAAFIIFEQQKIKVPYFWAPIAGIFLVGVAFALPFYLYLREKYLGQQNRENLNK